jgi:hypothetical protein
MSENVSLLQLKILILELMEAQSHLAMFLSRCADKYGPILTSDETVEGRELMRRVSAMTSKVSAYLDRPRDKLTEYHGDGVEALPFRGNSNVCSRVHN